MPNRLHLRPVPAQEEAQLRRLAASRTEPACLVQRARVIVEMLDQPGLPAEEAGHRAGFRSNESGCRWVRRFNERGLSSLVDEKRSGRPPTHDEQQKGKLIELALQKPASLGYPFALWTLERLQRAFLEREGIHLAISTIWEYVEAEGLRWKRQQSWFHEAEKQDPAFVEKRGPVLQPTSRRRSVHV